MKLLATLRGHSQRIAAPAWHPAGNLLATGSDDGSVKIWDFASRQLKVTLPGPAGVPVGHPAWASDGSCLAVGCADGQIRIWDTRNHWSFLDWRIGTADTQWTSQRPRRALIRGVAWSPLKRELAIASDDYTASRLRLRIPEAIIDTYECEDRVTSVAYSPDGAYLALGVDNGAIALIHLATGDRRSLQHHSSHVLDVCWSPDGEVLASASADSRICIWNRSESRVTNWLEGHTGAVGGISFSYDGRLLASKSNRDHTVRLWRSDSWECILAVPEESCPPFMWHNGLAFHPTLPILATLGEEDRAIRLWEVDIALLTRSKSQALHYRNARVVIVGESGAGKSALTNALKGEAFCPQESTHARQVVLLESSRIQSPESGDEIRELFLWDLAGQPGYRLTHQLHLAETDIALIVFDARQDIEPLASIKYWVRAFRQSRRQHQEGARIPKMFLVHSRCDRSGRPVSPERIAEWRRDLGFTHYFETSAKTGAGIAPLAQALRDAIDWNLLPAISSSQDLRQVYDFLLDQKRGGRVLASEEDLYRDFVQLADRQAAAAALFSSILCRLETRGCLVRLSFGNLILLQPEVLDIYASAIIMAAKNEPAGLGLILEQSVTTMNFALDRALRIPSAWQERLILIATIEEMLRREIALREASPEGSLLLFPSQLLREKETSAEPPPTPQVLFTFEGAIETLYASLIVRLSQSGLFTRTDMWSAAAAFTYGDRPFAEVHIREIDDGKAELGLIFVCGADPIARRAFDDYVRSHLERRANPGTVLRRRNWLCPQCATPVTDLQSQRRRERGFNWIACGVCETRISLEEAGATQLPSTNICDVDQNANAQRQSQVAETVLKGKVEARDFDVFLAHNSTDKPSVLDLAARLRSEGVNPWLDEEQLQPGNFFIDGIEQALQRVKAAAIIIGPNGAGKWSRYEARRLLSLCVNKEITLIPVLLPGVTALPEDLSFLSELSLVQFAGSLTDPAALAKLLWGITGQRTALTLA